MPIATTGCVYVCACVLIDGRCGCDGDADERYSKSITKAWEPTVMVPQREMMREEGRSALTDASSSFSSGCLALPLLEDEMQSPLDRGT